MTTLIETILTDDVFAKLDAIQINGNPVSVLPGYLVHYAKDLLNNKNGVSFPCVAVQPVDDVITLNAATTQGRISRQMRIIGAVDARQRELVNARVNELLYETRRALAIDKFDNDSEATDIELGATTFDLPDSQDQYAFFEMTITINYVERWKAQ